MKYKELEVIENDGSIFKLNVDLSDVVIYQEPAEQHIKYYGAFNKLDNPVNPKNATLVVLKHYIFNGANAIIVVNMPIAKFKAMLTKYNNG
jgi:hypothetical protein